MSSVVLKSSGVIKFNQGHPWLFSNQIRYSQRESVGLYDLLDEEGRWLAKGLLNPKSKIAFRVLTMDKNRQSMSSKELVEKLILESINPRESWLNLRYSCRLVHGESDHLSGLIVDAFFTSGEDSNLFLVVQSQSAGMDALQEDVIEVLSRWASQLVKSRKDISQFHILVKNDSSKRLREGLETESAKSVAGDSVSEVVSIRVGSINHPELLSDIQTHLWKGQKTGFFLDQSFNIDVVYELILRMNIQKIKMLDICTYVGQWSTKLSRGLATKNIGVESMLLDSSESALALATKNVESAGGTPTSIRKDVFKSDWGIPEKTFEVVICDPPALIKNRKDIEVGKHGYLKLNTFAIQKVKKDGLIVSCSCSGVLDRKDFKELLQKSAQRAGRRVLWMAEGRQSSDHPIRDWFPEGEYLKCWIGKLLD